MLHTQLKTLSEKLQTFTVLSKKQKNKTQLRFTESLRVWSENACRDAASLLTVYKVVTCKFPGGPEPLRGAWAPQAKLC